MGSLVAGAVMIANEMVRIVAGKGLSVYANAGWLKPAHAVLLHAITVLPGLAWLSGVTGWDERRRYRVTALACAGYAVFAGTVTVANLAGGDHFARP